jgi:hypothetical protein
MTYATRTVRDWENVFSAWAQPPGTTEQQRCANAERAIREAIAASSKLNRRDIKVFVQGSYRNRVNVRQESDVDIGIVCRDTFYFGLPDGNSREEFGLTTPATYGYAQFKNEVEEALVAHFGYAAVHRGNKAFDVRANTYRVDADVAPFFEYRRYTAPGRWHEGVKLLPDNGGEVINWPEQHYANGVAKNDRTSKAFKGVVRALKRLCLERREAGLPVADTTCGYLLECMTYNVPDANFGAYTWHDRVRAVLAHLFNSTRTESDCSKWVEVSDLKWLFYGQKWTWQQAHAWTAEAWDFIGYE